MTTVYIIRHAEAEGNLYRRIHGWYDSLLTEQGLKQVEALRKRFEGTQIDAVYSSDKKRTIATAQALMADRDIELQITPLLREMGMGKWEDGTWGDFQKYDTQQYDYFNKDPDKYCVEGSESHAYVQKRIVETVLDLAKKHDGETIALFSHGAAIRAFQAYFLGIPSERITEVEHGDNTAVTKVLIDGDKVEFCYLSDGSHIAEMSRMARQLWWKTGGAVDSRAMRYVEADLEKDRETYLNCRREEYEFNNGCLDGFCESCADRAAERKTYWAIKDEKIAGLVELDAEKGADEGVGYIDYYCMLPEYRGQTLAVQLLGQAVSVYRAMGRTKLRLDIPAKNEHAIGFFEHFGFERVTNDKTITMEKDI